MPWILAAMMAAGMTPQARPPAPQRLRVLMETDAAGKTIHVALTPP